MLIDEIEITLKAGDGGRGIVSFGRYIKSGPDGGNGGDAGDVYVVASSDLTLLNQFRAKNRREGEDGGSGGKDKRTGKDGEDLMISLPVGTFLEDKDTRETFELTKVGQKILLCKGGEGGVGNYDLRSSTNTTPKNTLPPTKGQERQLKLTMRFLADFGLIGLPSAGKSSLLNELTSAKAKTAEYHFTTLSPNLGVLPSNLSAGKAGKIIADIPGLIEGASKGKGLGTKFLKHIQKVSLLVHCISTESADPLSDYEVIRKELGEYDKKLLHKKEIIVITKTDLVNKKRVEEMVEDLKKTKRKVLTTSIHDLESIEGLIRELK